MCAPPPICLQANLTLEMEMDLFGLNGSGGKFDLSIYKVHSSYILVVLNCKLPQPLWSTRVLVMKKVEIIALQTVTKRKWPKWLTPLTGG